MKPLKFQLLAVADEYGRATSLSPSRVSTLAFNDGKVLPRLARDGDITTGRCERAIAWFADNWPDKGSWPSDVLRPACSAATVNVADTARASA